MRQCNEGRVWISLQGQMMTGLLYTPVKSKFDQTPCLQSSWLHCFVYTGTAGWQLLCQVHGAMCLHVHQLLSEEICDVFKLLVILSFRAFRTFANQEQSQPGQVSAHGLSLLVQGKWTLTTQSPSFIQKLLSSCQLHSHSFLLQLGKICRGLLLQLACFQVGSTRTTSASSSTKVILTRWRERIQQRSWMKFCILCGAEAQDQKHEKSLAFNAFGTACVRMVLHLLQKEKAAKQDTFESFQEIVQKFQDDLSGGGVPAPPAAPPVLATSSAGSSKGVQDLVNCSSKEIALVQNSHIKVGERPVCFKRMCGVCTLVCQWLCIEKKYKN